MTDEVNNLNTILNFLNGDLKMDYEEIKRFKAHNSQLESMVLRKEETIVLLKDKIKCQHL